MSLGPGYFLFTIPASQVYTRLNAVIVKANLKVTFSNCTRQLLGVTACELVLPNNGLYHLRKTLLLAQDKAHKRRSSQGTVTEFSLLVGTRAYLPLKMSRSLRAALTFSVLVLRSLLGAIVVDAFPMKWLLRRMPWVWVRPFALKNSMSLSYAS